MRIAGLLVRFAGAHRERGKAVVKRLTYLICVLLAIPALGWAVALVIRHQVEIGAVCRFSFRPHCSQLGGATDLLEEVSVVLVGAGLLLPIVFWVASLLIGTNRRWLALVFPGLVRVSLIALAILVVAQAAVFVYAVYLGGSYGRESVPGALPEAVAVGSLVVCLILIKNALTMGGRQHLRVAGKLLDRNVHARAHALVDGVAQRLGARSPDNIVVGLDPTFFATSSRVSVFCRSQPLQGETLFLSLPLSRVLTFEEMTAIIGHELGHFRGKDTTYSVRFAPVYAGLASALLSMKRARHWGFRLAALPASVLLAFMLEVFSRNERKISREREFEADRAATEVASSSAFESALIKVAVFAPLWSLWQLEDAGRLSKGLATGNMSASFADFIRHDLDTKNLAVHMDEMLQTRISHPTDSHPPIAERLAAIRGSLPCHDVADLLMTGVGTTTALGDLEDVERELTAVTRKHSIDAGLCTQPTK